VGIPKRYFSAFSLELDAQDADSIADFDISESTPDTSMPLQLNRRIYLFRRRGKRKPHYGSVQEGVIKNKDKNIISVDFLIRL
jgi:hypothetical protein